MAAHESGEWYLRWHRCGDWGELGAEDKARVGDLIEQAQSQFAPRPAVFTVIGGGQISYRTQDRGLGEAFRRLANPRGASAD